MQIFNFKREANDLVVLCMKGPAEYLASAFSNKEARINYYKLNQSAKGKFLRITGMLGIYYLLPEYLHINWIWPLMNLSNQTKETYMAALHDQGNGEGLFVFYPHEVSINNSQTTEWACINKNHMTIMNAENEYVTKGKGVTDQLKDKTWIELLRFSIDDICPELKSLFEKYYPGIFNESVTKFNTPQEQSAQKERPSLGELITKLEVIREELNKVISSLYEEKSFNDKFNVQIEEPETKQLWEDEKQPVKEVKETKERQRFSKTEKQELLHILIPLYKAGLSWKHAAKVLEAQQGIKLTETNARNFYYKDYLGQN